MIEISNMVEILKYNTEYDKISESLQDYEFIEFNRKNNPHNLVIMQTYILNGEKYFSVDIFEIFQIYI